jgi:serine/threonine-protein kinase HipA
MAQSRAEKFYSDQTTFLTKRFDRDDKGKRQHFFSAMTLLGYLDGEDAQAGVSYLELVELLQERGANSGCDLEQLWRRIVFSICVSNTDDHLRNHGFMLTNNGLILSPAYDLNPNPKGYGLNLNIDEQDNRLEADLAFRVAPFFRLSQAKAKQIMKEIEQVVAGWKTDAERLNISNREIEQMSPAFLPYL